MKTKIEPLAFPGVFLATSDRFDDERGTFLEGYREGADGIPAFVQGNISISGQHVLRGLHYQVKKPQGKFMRTVHGRTFNAIADMRLGSKTLGEALWVELDDPAKALWVPPGFANGFLALEPDTVVVYECSTLYHVGYDRAVYWGDRQFSIPWPVLPVRCVVSEKDARAPSFLAAEKVMEPEWKI